MTSARPSRGSNDLSVRRRTVLLAIGAAGVLVSGFIHYYLYFEGGYRGIAPEELLGLTISRSFALNAIAGLLLAEMLVVSIRFPRWTLPAVLGGVGFAAAAIVAYVLSRTTGLLGFEDDQTSVEAVIAVVAELAAIAALGPVLVGLRPVRQSMPPAAG